MYQVLVNSKVVYRHTDPIEGAPHLFNLKI
eukprot:SAG31_NODE_2542_length_5534_cov_31.055934_4_plen_30_part_00